VDRRLHEAAAGKGCRIVRDGWLPLLAGQPPSFRAWGAWLLEAATGKGDGAVNWSRKLAGAIAGLGLLALAGDSNAISLLVSSIATNAPNTANLLTTTTGRHAEYTSTRTILDSGGTGGNAVGTNLDARTRYASITSTDTGSFSLGQVVAATANYKITFSVTAPANVVYDLTIDTSRVGAFTLIDDTALNGPTRADLGAVTGQLGGVTNAGLGLADLANVDGAGNTNIGTVNTPFNQTSQLVLTGLSGNQSFTLDFAWTSLVYSNPGSNTTSTNSSNGAFVFGGDEAAVRMGLAGSATSISGGITADDYPGAGSRTAANDGHFVGIGLHVTAVPEPTTALLIGAGVAGLAWSGRRRIR
jgi:PEP-CTERM motif